MILAFCFIGIVLLIAIMWMAVLCFGALCNIENAVDELAEAFKEDK